MRIDCPHCGRQGSLPEGRKLPKMVRCPGCGTAFQPIPPGPTLPAPRPAEPPTDMMPPPSRYGSPSPIPPTPLYPVPVEAPQAQPPARVCDFCGEAIQLAAKKCKHCGETLDPVLRAKEEATRARHAPAHPAPVTIYNQVVASATASAKAASGGSCLGTLSGCLVLIVLGTLVMFLVSTPRRPPVPEPAPAPFAPKPAIIPDPIRPAGEAAPILPRAAEVGRPAEPLAPPSEPTPDATKGPKSAGTGAETKMKMAKGLEILNPQAAIRYYREVVEGFPDTVEAEKAQKRIKALEKKP